MSSSPAVHSGVVVAVDGSPASQVAVRWAATAAAMRNVELSVIYVLPTERPSPVEFVFAPAAHLQQQQEDAARKIIAEAIELARAVAGNHHLEVSGEIRQGAAVPTLVELSRQAHMVVVGSSGRGAFSRALLGSVSTGLVYHAACPVAVIHDSPAPSEPDTRPVVVGIDGSPASDAAAGIAFDEASWRGVDLIAIHAWNDSAAFSVPTMQWSDLRTSADAVLAERLAGFRDRYPDVNVERILVLEHPSRHLCEQSESAQLVVVGSHGRGGFTGMLLGSVSTAVVHGASCPVIVARPH